MNDENLKKGVRFTSEYQPSPEAKSRGQIEAARRRNLIETLRSRIEEWDLIDKVVSGVDSEINDGNLKNAIELLKIAKEPEKQEINLSGSKGVIIEVANEEDKGIIEGI